MATGFGRAPFGTSPFGRAGTDPGEEQPPIGGGVFPRPHQPRLHSWKAYARNSDYRPTVALPISSGQIVVRHVGVGQAILVTDYTRDRWDALQPGAGIIVYRDGREEFTGPVRGLTKIFDETAGRMTIRVECRSDEQVLAERIVFPDPLRAPDDQTVSDYWTHTGTASAAMRQLISDQAGPTCHPGRRVPGLALGPDPNVGVSRSWTGLFTSDGKLLEKLALMSVASGADLGVRVVGSAGSLVASVTEPNDLSDTMKFAVGLRNLKGYTYRLTAPTVTHVVAAGQGDLRGRLRRSAATSDPLALEWGMQSWAYVDRRDTADTVELDQAAADELSSGGASIQLAVSLTDSQAATYGTDWGLGDRIRIFVGPADEPAVAEVSDVVREIAFEVSADGVEKITPAVGTADAMALPSSPTQEQLRAIGLRLSGLESNK